MIETIDVRRYIRLPWRLGGRDRTGVDCWGLYRLIVADVAGVDLDAHGDVASYPAVARRLGDEERAGRWVAVAPGDEHPLDLVLMTGLLRGDGGRRTAPLHVGCVIEPGLMIDVEEETGVMVRAYRSTVRRPVLPTVAPRFLGLHRPTALAGRIAA